MHALRYYYPSSFITVVTILLIIKLGAYLSIAMKPQNHFSYASVFKGQLSPQHTSSTPADQSMMIASKTKGAGVGNTHARTGLTPSTATRLNSVSNPSAILTGAFLPLQEHYFQGQIMLLICGIPGCGKSTFVRRLMGELSPEHRMKWESLNQDKIGSRRQVEFLTRKELRRGRSVIIDRCNFDVKQRKHWIDIAREFNIDAVYCLILPDSLNLNVCVPRAFRRGNSDGIHAANTDWNAVCRRMVAEFVYPKTYEGISSVLHCRSDADVAAVIQALGKIDSSRSDRGALDTNNQKISGAQFESRDPIAPTRSPSAVQPSEITGVPSPPPGFHVNNFTARSFQQQQQQSTLQSQQSKQSQQHNYSYSRGGNLGSPVSDELVPPPPFELFLPSFHRYRSIRW